MSARGQRRHAGDKEAADLLEVMLAEQHRRLDQRDHERSMARLGEVPSPPGLTPTKILMASAAGEQPGSQSGAGRARRHRHLTPVTS